MTSNDEILYYMLGQVNQERVWDLPQALTLCATNRCHWQRERDQSENHMLYFNKNEQREREVCVGVQ
jgi:hypothetical protein